MQRVFRPLNSKTGVLTPSWLLGPCPLLAQHPSSLGWDRGRAGSCVPSPWGYKTLRDCSRAPLPARGELDPFLAQCLLAGAPPHKGSVYTFRKLCPFSVACIFYSQSSPSSCSSTLPPPSGAVGVAEFGPPVQLTRPSGFRGGGNWGIKTLKHWTIPKYYL